MFWRTCAGSLGRQKIVAKRWMRSCVYKRKRTKSRKNGGPSQVSLLLLLGPRANLTNRPRSPGASMECLANAESVFLVTLQDCDPFMLERVILFRCSHLYLAFSGEDTIR